MSRSSPIISTLSPDSSPEVVGDITSKLWAGDHTTGILVIQSFVDPNLPAVRTLRSGKNIDRGFVSVTRSTASGLVMLAAIGALQTQARSEQDMGLPDPWKIRTETDINREIEDSIPTLHFYALLRGASMAINLTDHPERQVDASTNDLAIVRGDHGLTISASHKHPVLICSAYPGTKQVAVASPLPPARRTGGRGFQEVDTRRPHQITPKR